MATLLDIFIGLVVLLILAEALTFVIELILQKKSEKNKIALSDKALADLDFLCNGDTDLGGEIIEELISAEANSLYRFQSGQVCHHEHLTAQKNGKYTCDYCGIEMEYEPPF